MRTVDIINNIMDKYYFTEEIKDDEELKAILKKEIDKSSFNNAIYTLIEKKRLRNSRKCYSNGVVVKLV